MWQRSHPPRRILVGGCGTGREAFSLGLQFPEARVIAVDFNARSIAIAKEIQRRNPNVKNVRFVVCDLASSRFYKMAGDRFDFVSCHGVLSYIPRARAVLQNLARCLVADGALYLGVNGKTHFSENRRKALLEFGVDLSNFRDTKSIRRLLALLDAICGETEYQVAGLKSGYLSSDLFGPLIQNWTLARWSTICGAAGLDLLASYSIFPRMRSVINKALYRLLMPRSRAQVVAFFELLRPSLFHRLLFSRQLELRPPWGEPDKLYLWRPIMTGLFPQRRQHHEPLSTTFRTVRLKSPSTNTLLELRIPRWVTEILRPSAGESSVAQILESIHIQPSWHVVRDCFYLLYQLGVVNLLPPKR